MEIPSSMIITVSIVVLVLVVLAGALTQSGKTAQCEASSGFCAQLCSSGFFELKADCVSPLSACCIEVSPHNEVEIIEGDLFP